MLAGFVFFAATPLLHWLLIFRLGLGLDGSALAAVACDALYLLALAACVLHHNTAQPAGRKPWQGWSAEAWACWGPYVSAPASPQAHGSALLPQPAGGALLLYQLWQAPCVQRARDIEEQELMVPQVRVAAASAAYTLLDWALYDVTTMLAGGRAWRALTVRSLLAAPCPRSAQQCGAPAPAPPPCSTGSGGLWAQLQRAPEDSSSLLQACCPLPRRPWPQCPSATTSTASVSFLFLLFLKREDTPISELMPHAGATALPPLLCSRKPRLNSFK